jgi:hypothetical protein
VISTSKIRCGKNVGVGLSYLDEHAIKLLQSLSAILSRVLELWDVGVLELWDVAKSKGPFKRMEGPLS